MKTHTCTKSLKVIALTGIIIGLASIGQLIVLMREYIMKYRMNLMFPEAIMPDGILLLLFFFLVVALFYMVVKAM